MRILVVGAVAAGMSAASQAKRRAPDAEVVVFERGHDISYGACGMPYKLAHQAGSLDALVAVTVPEARSERKLELRLGSEATAIDTDKRVLTVRGPLGVRREPYDALVLATGARAVRPELPGLDLPGVFVLRTLDDGRKLKAHLGGRSLKRAVILGAGYVGLEMAEAFAARGLEVTVLERGPRLMPGYEPEIAALVAQELHRRNVVVRTGAEALKIVQRSDGLRVALEKEELRADVVLVAVGVRPESDLAARAGITLGPSGAIAVDASQRTSAAQVFAAGDCAEAYHRVLGAPAYVPLGTTANKQGKVAGANAAGADERFAGIVGTAAFKVFATEVARTGLGPGELARAGMRYVRAVSTQLDHAGSVGTPSKLTTVTFSDPATGKLLGAQMAGEGVVAKRVDVLATALFAGLTTADVAGLDLSYAPPVAPVYDPVLIAGSVAQKAEREAELGQPPQS
jgi:NADPH-dependent 2,4-dienoyl-CoA reductase/sulfur reductase-like enzyme